jgi:uncharacterized protein YbcC (UPF0753/DUF2309 family)
MNQPALASNTPTNATVLDAAQRAGERIAPTWPLDQLIAVNPWWEMRDRALPEVAARISLFGHAQCLMPREWFRERWLNGISRAQLRSAAAENNLEEQALIDWLDASDTLQHWRNFSDQVDGSRNLARQVSWHEEIVQQISQFCASFHSAASPLPAEPDLCLYQAWLDSVRNDRGIEIMMGEHGLHRQFLALPDDHETLLLQAADELGVPDDALADYFHALLLDINGWASWVAYLRWQARLTETDTDALPQLLAVRLAWELALWRHLTAQGAEGTSLLRRQWQQQFERLPTLIEQHASAQQPAWVWQRAAEIAYQEALGAELLKPAAEADDARPALQAAFCIDVRSEVYRRALEAQDPRIQTLGFAGFFGLPIAYEPSGTSYRRPQLPGLLGAAITVSEDDAHPDVAARSRRLNRRARWDAVSKTAPASFGFVESAGIGYAFRLLRESFLGGAAHHPVNSACPNDAHFTLRQGESILDAAAQAELAASILGAMTLTANFAPVVILAGHGSSTRNNPHAAGLDCGACCGQTGEINVRVLSQVLNDTDVREVLRGEHGIDIPADTHFVAALHDTTTDDVHCLGEPPTGFEEVAGWLQAAGHEARRERAGALGVDPANSDDAIRQRSRDWSQVRPEWGLANNAAFIVAPRQRTRHIDLGGRSFLHDYDAEADAKNGYAVLELIMTAPMVVTHWINMQYNASVTDNARYGSGNKVLHNVVGGNIGVFEGNGGDLRIGLPLQSLHDGERWMHDPQRLSVYMAAPAEAIADIAARHEVVRELIDNDWLYLFRIDDEAGQIQRLYRGQWSTVAS